MFSAANDYILCQNDASMVSEASNYLTEQVRLYVITAEKQYAENYLVDRQTAEDLCKVY